jgi:hypothetical protein
MPSLVDGFSHVYPEVPGFFIIGHRDFRAARSSRVGHLDDFAEACGGESWYLSATQAEVRPFAGPDKHTFPSGCTY